MSSYFLLPSPHSVALLITSDFLRPTVSRAEAHADSLKELLARSGAQVAGRGHVWHALRDRRPHLLSRVESSRVESSPVESSRVESSPVESSPKQVQSSLARAARSPLPTLSVVSGQWQVASGKWQVVSGKW